LHAQRRSPPFGSSDGRRGRGRPEGGRVMRSADRRELQRMVESVGALGFKVVRENKHIVFDILFEDRPPIRSVMPASCSDRRGAVARLAWIRRAVRNTAIAA